MALTLGSAPRLDASQWGALAHTRTLCTHLVSRAAGVQPEPRAHAAAAMLGGGSMAVFGGQRVDGSYLSDVWVFNITAKSWRRVEVEVSSSHP